MQNLKWVRMSSMLLAAVFSQVACGDDDASGTDDTGDSDSDSDTDSDTDSDSDTGSGNGVELTLVAIEDFPIIDVDGFVPAEKDTGRNALSVNSIQYPDEFAAAQVTFSKMNGTYDVTLVSLVESDGECTYRLNVAGTKIGEFQNPYIGPDSAKEYDEYEHVFENVPIKNGDVIQVEFNSHTNGEVPEGGGTAYARGRWRKLIIEG